MKNIFKQKGINWVIFFSGLFFLQPLESKSQKSLPGDTAFISELVQFYEQRCGHSLKGSLFSEMASDTPYIFLYVSKKQRVENALTAGGYYIFCNSNLNKAK